MKNLTKEHGKREYYSSRELRARQDFYGIGMKDGICISMVQRRKLMKYSGNSKK